MQTGIGDNACAVTCDPVTLSFHFQMSSGKKRTITFLTRSAFDVAVKSPFDSVGGTCPGVLNLKSTVECAALQEEIDTIRYYETWFLTQMCARFSPSRSAAPWEEGADALVPANQR